MRFFYDFTKVLKFDKITMIELKIYSIMEILLMSIKL